MTGEIKGRPLSRRRDRATGRHLPIKPHTVRRLLQHRRQAVRWAGRHRESDRFGRWRPPSDWQDLFGVEPKQLMSKAERDRAADGPEQLTVGEIVRLYRAACGSRGDLHQILLLQMGLFTAPGQSELASVRREELDLDAAAFTHRRNKTGQMGVYWLPPELVSLLRAYFGDHPARGRRVGVPHPRGPALGDGHQ